MFIQFIRLIRLLNFDIFSVLVGEFYCALIRFFRLCLDELHKCPSTFSTSFQGFNIPPSHVLALALASSRKRIRPCFSPKKRRRRTLYFFAAPKL
nr:MAG TPA: hypothetical protein [Caudoviricetes sp.]